MPLAVLVTFSVYLRVTHERKVGALNMIYYDVYVCYAYIIYIICQRF